MLNVVQTQSFWETCCPHCYRTMQRIVVDDYSRFWCFRCYPSVTVAASPAPQDRMEEK